MLNVMLAGGTATLVALLGTRLFIRFLVRRGYGQPIHDDLVLHHVKRGKPTMSGAVIIAATLHRVALPGRGHGRPGDHDPHRAAPRHGRRPVRHHHALRDHPGRQLRLTGRRVFRIAPLHHHFEVVGWAEITIVIRFWIIAGICVLAGLSLFYGELGRHALARMAVVAEVDAARGRVRRPSERQSSQVDVVSEQAAS